MATVTKQAYGQDFTGRRTGYRIRVRSQQPFRDFHFLLRKDADRGVIFGNVGDEVAILRPDVQQPGPQDLEYGDLDKKAPTRRWKGAVDGWGVPEQHQANDKTRTYISFRRVDCQEGVPVTELTFDLVIDDITRVERWHTTSDCQGELTAGAVIEEGTEIPDN